MFGKSHSRDRSLNRKERKDEAVTIRKGKAAAQPSSQGRTAGGASAIWKGANGDGKHTRSGAEQEGGCAGDGCEESKGREGSRGACASPPADAKGIENSEGFRR